MGTSLLKNNSFKFIIFLLLLVLFFYSGKLFSFNEEIVKGYFTGVPLSLSVPLFIFLYVVLTFFIWFGPKDILRIVGAALFGGVGSTIVVWIGEMFNVIVLFTLSRKLGRSFVERKLKGKIQHLDETIATTSYWVIFFLKFFPIVPFRILDLGFGLTKISLKKYFIVSAIASPMRIFFVQFFLAVGMETITNPDRLSAYLESHPFIMYSVFFYVVGSFVMIFFLKRNSRKN